MFALIDSLKKNMTDFFRWISSAQLGNVKQEAETGIHIICLTWNATLGGPEAAVTHVAALHCIRVSSTWEMLMQPLG